jgi:hypothetical protein
MCQSFGSRRRGPGMLRLDGKSVGEPNERKQNTVGGVESSESFAQPHGANPLPRWFLSPLILEPSRRPVHASNVVDAQAVQPVLRNAAYWLML